MTRMNSVELTIQDAAVLALQTRGGWVREIVDDAREERRFDVTWPLVLAAFGNVTDRTVPFDADANRSEFREAHSFITDRERLQWLNEDPARIRLVDEGAQNEGTAGLADAIDAGRRLECDLVFDAVVCGLLMRVAFHQ